MHTVSLPRPGPEKSSEPKLTVAIGAALIVQTALALIWTGGASERLAQLEHRAEVQAVLMERTARLEEQIASVRESLIRIENKLDDRAEAGR